MSANVACDPNCPGCPCGELPDDQEIDAELARMEQMIRRAALIPSLIPAARVLAAILGECDE